jgi:hypothetical protein
VAIFGSGASVPRRGLRGTLVDFDARLLDMAPTDGRSVVEKRSWCYQLE